MAAQKRRTFPRIQFETPIKYAPNEIDGFFDSTVLNSSEGGLYFEPGIPLAPESDVHIVMVNYSPAAYGPVAYRTYKARIAWCREIERKFTPRFGVGAEFLAKSHEIIHENLEGLNQACDLCGSMVPVNNIQENKEYLCLCGHCHKHMGALPDGKIKDSISRFLMGNVI